MVVIEARVKSVLGEKGSNPGACRGSREDQRRHLEWHVEMRHELVKWQA